MRRHLVVGRPQDEDGFVLVVVMGAMLVLSLFLFATIAYAVNNLPASARDVAGKRAVAAAQAGADEYVSRLNVDNNYWTNNGVDASNTAYTGWKTVQGTGSSGAQYTYRLLTTPANTFGNGVIRLQVTGRALTGGVYVTRQLIVSLSRAQGLADVYYTYNEDTDPALYDTSSRAQKNGKDYNDDTANSILYIWYSDPSQVDTICAKHYYDGRATPTYNSGNYRQIAYPYTTDSNGNRTYGAGVTTTQTASSSVVITVNCQEIQWQTGDVVNGNLETNDALQIQGNATYNGKVQTGWADSATPAPAANHRWWGTGTPSTAPTYHVPNALPDTNTQLRSVADPSQSGAVGCLYAGGTKITFSGSTMTVFSPATTATNTPSRCLDVSNNGNPQTKPIPPVIYIDNASTCGSVTSVGYPVSGEFTGAGTTTTNYDCHKGNAYISGTLDSAVTVGTANDAVFTGDTTYQSGTSGTNLLGVIANNNIWVYHPVKNDGSNVLTASGSVHNIVGDLWSLQHSFIVQNYQYGASLSSSTDNATKLNVTGSIIQHYRGPVGTGVGSTMTGYFKNYVYDSRLSIFNPPYFLTPATAPWGVVKTTD